MIALNINGERRELDIPPGMPLLWALRNELGLVGTKFGCGTGLCGACTVHLDGQPQRACLLPAGSVGERAVTTIEAVGGSEAGRKIKTAWLDLDVPQCGYCQAGQIMSAAALLASNPQPDAAAITAAMRGNLCRCATYDRIVQAIAQAASAEQPA